MTKLVFPLVTVFALAAIGCEAPELSDSSTTATSPAPPAEPAPTMVAGVPGDPLPDEDIPVTDVPRKVHPNDPVKGRRSRRAAEGGYSLGIGTTAAAGFYATHKLIYDAISYANVLYNATNSKWPPSHEAFVKDVVPGALNGQEMPKLGPGREYIYVPEMADIGLMIRLTPGSPDSKLPAPEPGQEHLYDPKAVAATGATVPGLQADGSFDVDIAMSAANAAIQDPEFQPEANVTGPSRGPSPIQQANDPAAAAEATAPPAAEEPAEEEPIYNIRERAGAIGGAADDRTQEALEGGP